MKKYFLLIMLLGLFASCQEDVKEDLEDVSQIEEKPKSKISLTFDFDARKTLKEILKEYDKSGAGFRSTIRLEVYEYNKYGEKIYCHTYEDVQYKDVFKEELKEETIKVKVYIAVDAQSRSTGESVKMLKWMKEQFFIDEGRTEEIWITGETILIDNEPT